MIGDPAVFQPDELKAEFCCKVKPVALDGHATTAVLDEVRKIRNVGDPMVCTTDSKLQNPPVSEKLPPVIGPPASCCPIVPLTVNCPLLLVPPPPAILYQSME